MDVQAFFQDANSIESEMESKTRPDAVGTEGHQAKDKSQQGEQSVLDAILYDDNEQLRGIRRHGRQKLADANCERSSASSAVATFHTTAVALKKLF